MLLCEAYSLDFVFFPPLSYVITLIHEEFI